MVKSKTSLFYWLLITCLILILIGLHYAGLLQNWEVGSGEFIVNIIVVPICVVGSLLLFVFRKEVKIKDNMLKVSMPLLKQKEVFKLEDLISWTIRNVKNNHRAKAADHRILRFSFKNKEISLSEIEFSNLLEFIEFLRENYNEKEV